MNQLIWSIQFDGTNTALLDREPIISNVVHVPPTRSIKNSELTDLVALTCKSILQLIFVIFPLKDIFKPLFFREVLN